MKVALAVNKIENCMEKNLKNIVFYINKAADEKTDLVLFMDRVKKTSTITLGTNYLDEEYFGGAFIILERGK